ncbi:hypothetical protein [Steroidobacter cummioxidans]|uniref:hypothetical protein n=1 Tax=Steroidobacter cummioxidans TaxID=1803913 RepID=UPI000E31E2A9|nr:hypothetical protein [Steroidobacter cummioxidans]
MNRIVVGAAIVALVIGVAAGGYGGMLYSRNQWGLELLERTYRDAEQQVRFYEKLRALQAAGEYKRVADALDSQLEMARLSSRAAEMAMKEPRPAE